MAAEGVIEINHARALAGGLTAGDAPGYPVTLSVSGSYALTGNLAPSSGDAISIEADDVSIDLRGFTVSASINGVSPLVASTSLSDGSVAGGDVFLGDRSTAHRLDVSGGGQVLVGDESSVVEITVTNPVSDGILAGDGSRVANSRIRGGVYGISAGADVRLENNLVRDCQLDGVDAGLSARIEGNTIIDVGRVGIGASRGSLLIGNTVRGASTSGYSIAADAGYRDNVFIDNNGGNTNPQGSGGIELGSNVCGGDTSCP